jgi:xanthine dehydrogenase accessory factor
MIPGSALDRRMEELYTGRTPFVRATVVRGRRPTSARPGDTAIVLPDGRIEGFVGGVCAESTVRLQALRSLRTGEPLLLRISPDAKETQNPDLNVDGRAEEDGRLTVANPCLSGGEMEIFLEPLLPPTRIVVVGQAPIAAALVALGPVLEYDVRTIDPEELTETALSDTSAVIVASHGRGEEKALTMAVHLGIPYVALVSSRKRGAAVLAGLELSDEERVRIHDPAGLWIGAKTPGEIAVSILAEFIAAQRGVPVGHAANASAESSAASGTTPDPPTAIDPVCGMTVAVVPETLHSDVDGERHWFCRPGCREAYEADPARYASVGV